MNFICSYIIAIIMFIIIMDLLFFGIMHETVSINVYVPLHIDCEYARRFPISIIREHEYYM